jgi:hypothetical protein
METPAPNGAPSTLPVEPKRKDAHLVQHNLATLDVTKLNPLSPEIISRQATINIGNYDSMIVCETVSQTIFFII